MQALEYLEKELLSLQYGVAGIVEHKKDNRVYEKDTADIKSIIRSISTLDNGEIETVDDIENTDNDYDEE